LKNQLSQYLQQVKLGERVLITEHNKIIAEISLPKERTSDGDVEHILDQLTVSGKLLKAKRNHSIAISSTNTVKLDWISIYEENKSEE